MQIRNTLVQNPDRARDEEIARNDISQNADAPAMDPYQMRAARIDRYEKNAPSAHLSWR